MIAVVVSCMGKLQYHSISVEGYDAVKEISSQVEEVTDAAHLGPWELARDGDTMLYTYNNTSETVLPPLMLEIRDDDVIRLLTTAYGEKTVSSGRASLARKGTERDASAREWVASHFKLAE